MKQKDASILSKQKPVVNNPKGAAWADYLGTFVQRIPSYAVKFPGGSWATRRGPLTDRPVEAHLAGKYAVGVLGSAYPLYGIIDVDNRDKGEVERIRDALGMDKSTSMAFESESPNSYHVVFKPEYNGRPPSIRLLGELFKNFARTSRIEIYPQWRHAVRLPFGPKQTPADEDYRGLESWEDAVYWFGKLDDYSLKNVRQAQLELDIPIIGRQSLVNSLNAREVFENGLQAADSRNSCQFIILLWLWRQNVPQEQAETIVWDWIQQKHNGFSKDIGRHPRAVQKEIMRQATSIWGRYDFGRVLPDAPALAHDGYISKPDLLEIIKATKGSLPRSRFLTGLVKFMNPRRYRLSVGVSYDRLTSWASWRTYEKYLKELSALGIVRRGRAYQAGKFSKSIKMLWPWASPASAVLYDGRSAETFDDAARLILKPDELKQALEAQGRKRTGIIKAVHAVYGDRRGEKRLTPLTPSNSIPENPEDQI